MTAVSRISRKTWAYIRADSVVRGDIVAEFGVVDEVHLLAGEVVCGGTRREVTGFVSVLGAQAVFELHDLVNVFRVHGEQGRQ